MRSDPKSRACGTCDARSTNSPVSDSTRYTRQASQPETCAVNPTISPSISSRDSSELTIRLTLCNTEASELCGSIISVAIIQARVSLNCRPVQSNLSMSLMLAPSQELTAFRLV